MANSDTKEKILEIRVNYDKAIQGLSEYMGKLEEVNAEEKKLRGRVLEFFGGRPLSAEVLYHRLEQEKLPFSLEEMEQLFAFDDHSLWKLNPERAKQEKSRWEKILTYTTLGKEHQKHRIGANPGRAGTALQKPL